MAEVIRMPRMSDTMTEGNIVGWLKEEGEAVEPGDTLAEVETDKATMELDSYSEGVLLHIAVKEGTVPINGVIAVVGEEGEDWKAAIAADEDSGSAPAASSPSPAADSAKAETVNVDIVESPSAAKPEARIKASPLAKSMASEAGIDISQITGSGDNGRIVKKDVEAFLGGSGSAPASAPTQPKAEKQGPPAVQPFVHSGDGGFEDVPMSMMRKAISKNVVANKFTAPHFYLTIEMDMEKAIESRAKMNEISPTKISYNDLVLKAAAVALRKHTVINASWLDDSTIRYNKSINIGVAVATPDGLLLPVIKHTDMKSLSQINAEVRSLAGLARDKKLPPEEMQGSTFMVSNLGNYGIEEFTAIVNRPNACSMAVGAIVDKPVVKDGAVVPGKRMKVTLSCDHRVVDGATGAEFLQTFKSVMEDPIRMLV
ncbi:MAG: dihydrolipoamide acetyltransferase family protein [Saprospiraceae bacterium]